MASVWIHKRPTKAGKTRYRVEYRLVGRSGSVFYGRTFGTLREAEIRKRWIADELDYASLLGHSRGTRREA
jgi:hypothetical protein